MEADGEDEDVKACNDGGPAHTETVAAAAAAAGVDGCEIDATLERMGERGGRRTAERLVRRVITVKTRVTN